MMRFLSPLLVGLAVLVASCAQPAPTATSAAKLDAAGAERLARVKLSTGQVDAAQVGLRDGAWASHRGVDPAAVAADAAIWVVVATGRFKADANGTTQGEPTATFDTANVFLRADTGEVLRTAFGGLQPMQVATPKVDAATAEQAARERLRASKVTELQAELKTVQWAHDNVALDQRSYTPESPIWIVTARGEIQPSLFYDQNPGGPTPNKLGILVVDPLNGQVLNGRTYVDAFTPEVAPSRAPLVTHSILAEDEVAPSPGISAPGMTSSWSP